MIVIPAAILSAVFVDNSSANLWSFLFAFIVLLGFFIAGFGAGRLRNDTPMMHGSIAAMACYLVVQLFGTVRRIAQGDSINLVSYPLMLMIAATCGVAGAVFADWSARKTAKMGR